RPCPCACRLAGGGRHAAAVRLGPSRTGGEPERKDVITGCELVITTGANIAPDTAGLEQTRDTDERMSRETSRFKPARAPAWPALFGQERPWRTSPAAIARFRPISASIGCRWRRSPRS